VGQWTEELAGLVVQTGFDSLVLGTEQPGQLAPLAEEVVPPFGS
jgi:hypothetical protein